MMKRPLFTLMILGRECSDRSARYSPAEFPVLGQDINDRWQGAQLPLPALTCAILSSIGSLPFMGGTIALNCPGVQHRRSRRNTRFRP